MARFEVCLDPHESALLVRCPRNLTVRWPGAFSLTEIDFNSNMDK